jgi:quinol monooxygenase YgiN
MSFMQIVTFTTTRLDEFRKLEHEWLAATTGRRTLLRSALYADRDVAHRYLAVNEFASHESAMVNSALPETSALAERAAELTDGPATFTNLDLIDSDDGRAELVARLTTYLETNRLPDGLFADDLVLDMNVPLSRFQLGGPAAMTELLAADAPHGRRFEEHSWVPTPDGFVLSWAWRTTGGEGESHYSRGVTIVELAGARIGRVTVHCSGDWDAGTEARQAREATMVDAMVDPS